MQKRLLNKIKKRSQRYFHYKYNFAPRNNNNYQLFSEGNQFYPAMIEAIEHAQSNVYIIQYIFETSLTSKEFIDTLIRAKIRHVNIQLILDAYGSKNLSTQEQQRLNNAGIEILFFNPLRSHHLIKFLYRDHRKLLIIDDTTAFIGGAGICDDYNYPLENSTAWQDIVLKITGDIALDCSTLFENKFTKLKTDNSEYKNKTSPDDIVKKSNLNLNTSQCRLLSSKTWHHNEIQRAILHAIRKAKKRIWITTPYFVPSRKLRSQLKAAAHRGCDVRLLLPGANSDHAWVNRIGQQRYSRLLKNHICIFEYQNRFTHAKAVLCDDWVCVGSSNLDRWNQKFNIELNIEIQSSQLADELSQFFENSFKNSIKIDPILWQARPRSQRIREWFWSKVAMWIERFIHNMR